MTDTSENMKWRSIETAPKDWTSIIVCFRSQYGRVVCEAMYNTATKEWNTYAGLLEDSCLIAWMPLPSPPKDDKT